MPIDGSISTELSCVHKLNELRLGLLEQFEQFPKKGSMPINQAKCSQFNKRFSVKKRKIEHSNC